MNSELSLILAVVAAAAAALILIRYAIRGLWRPQSQSQSMSQGGALVGAPFWTWIARLAALAAVLSVILQAAEMWFNAG